MGVKFVDLLSQKLAWQGLEAFLLTVAYGWAGEQGQVRMRTQCGMQGKADLITQYVA